MYHIFYIHSEHYFTLFVFLGIMVTMVQSTIALDAANLCIYIIVIGRVNEMKFPIAHNFITYY